jgi:drug/metabolite transporter (DMT)-like permease
MMYAKTRPAIIVAFAVIYVIWGSTYLAVAVALHAIPPFLLMGSRSIAGGCLLLAAAWASRQWIGVSSSMRAAACGVLFFVGCHGTLAYAQQHVPSALAAILLATIPFWIVLIGVVLPGRERPSLRQLGLLVPGLVGVALIVLGQTDGVRAAGHADLVLLLAAALSWAAGTVLSERWSPPDCVVAFSGMELMAGGMVLIIISAAFGELTSFNPQAVSAAALGGWAYLTIAGTVIGFATYIWLLKRVSPTLVATYTFVNPIIAVLLGWLVLGERMNGGMALGSVLVIVSVAGLLASRRNKPRPDERRSSASAHSGLPQSTRRATG